LPHWIAGSGSSKPPHGRPPPDVRATLSNADFVGGKVVFNIGGNKYRLISTISFEVQIVSVEAVLTHKEYDKGKWK
jgi:mRNA interferase HigB